MDTAVAALPSAYHRQNELGYHSYNGPYQQPHQTTYQRAAPLKPAMAAVVAPASYGSTVASASFSAPVVSSSSSSSMRCTCCPYGYHIDLGFLGFLDNSENLVQLRKIRRRRTMQRQKLETNLLMPQPPQNQQRSHQDLHYDISDSASTSSSLRSDDEDSDYGKNSVVASRLLEEIDASITDAFRSIDVLMTTKTKKAAQSEADSRRDLRSRIGTVYDNAAATPESSASGSLKSSQRIWKIESSSASASSTSSVARQSAWQPPEKSRRFGDGAETNVRLRRQLAEERMSTSSSSSSVADRPPTSLSLQLTPDEGSVSKSDFRGTFSTYDNSRSQPPSNDSLTTPSSVFTSLNDEDRSPLTPSSATTSPRCTSASAAASAGVVPVVQEPVKPSPPIPSLSSSSPKSPATVSCVSSNEVCEASRLTQTTSEAAQTTSSSLDDVILRVDEDEDIQKTTANENASSQGNDAVSCKSRTPSVFTFRAPLAATKQTTDTSMTDAGLLWKACSQVSGKSSAVVKPQNQVKLSGRRVEAYERRAPFSVVKPAAVVAPAVTEGTFVLPPGGRTREAAEGADAVTSSSPSPSAAADVVITDVTNDVSKRAEDTIRICENSTFSTTSVSNAVAATSVSSPTADRTVTVESSSAYVDEENRDSHYNDGDSSAAETLASINEVPCANQFLTPEDDDVMDGTAQPTTSEQLARAMAILMPIDASSVSSSSDVDYRSSSLPVSPSLPELDPDVLVDIRRQIAASLQQMRLLERQVKSIPLLQVRLSMLKEDKRLLQLQLLSAKNAAAAAAAKARSPTPDVDRRETGVQVEPIGESTHCEGGSVERYVIGVDGESSRTVISSSKTRELERASGETKSELAVGEGSVHLHVCSKCRSTLDGSDDNSASPVPPSLTYPQQLRSSTGNERDELEIGSISVRNERPRHAASGSSTEMPSRSGGRQCRVIVDDSDFCRTDEIAILRPTSVAGARHDNRPPVAPKEVSVGLVDGRLSRRSVGIQCLLATVVSPTPSETTVGQVIRRGSVGREPDLVVAHLMPAEGIGGPQGSADLAGLRESRTSVDKQTETDETMSQRDRKCDLVEVGVNTDAFKSGTRAVDVEMAVGSEDVCEAGTGQLLSGEREIVCRSRDGAVNGVGQRLVRQGTLSTAVTTGRGNEPGSSFSVAKCDGSAQTNLSGPVTSSTADHDRSEVTSSSFRVARHDSAQSRVAGQLPPGFAQETTTSSGRWGEIREVSADVDLTASHFEGSHEVRAASEKWQTAHVFHLSSAVPRQSSQALQTKILPSGVQVCEPAVRPSRRRRSRSLSYLDPRLGFRRNFSAFTADEHRELRDGSSIGQHLCSTCHGAQLTVGAEPQSMAAAAVTDPEPKRPVRDVGCGTDRVTSSTTAEVSTLTDDALLKPFTVGDASDKATSFSDSLHLISATKMERVVSADVCCNTDITLATPFTTDVTGAASLSSPSETADAACNTDFSVIPMDSTAVSGNATHAATAKGDVNLLPLSCDPTAPRPAVSTADAACNTENVSSTLADHASSIMHVKPPASTCDRDCNTDTETASKCDAEIQTTVAQKDADDVIQFVDNSSRAVAKPLLVDSSCNTDVPSTDQQPLLNAAFDDSVVSLATAELFRSRPTVVEVGCCTGDLWLETVHRERRDFGCSVRQSTRDAICDTESLATPDRGRLEMPMSQSTAGRASVCDAACITDVIGELRVSAATAAVSAAATDGDRKPSTKDAECMTDETAFRQQVAEIAPVVISAAEVIVGRAALAETASNTDISLMETGSWPVGDVVPSDDRVASWGAFAKISQSDHSMSEYGVERHMIESATSAVVVDRKTTTCEVSCGTDATLVSDVACVADFEAVRPTTANFACGTDDIPFESRRREATCNTDTSTKTPTTDVMTNTDVIERMIVCDAACTACVVPETSDAATECDDDEQRSVDNGCYGESTISSKRQTRDCGCGADIAVIPCARDVASITDVPRTCDASCNTDCVPEAASTRPLMHDFACTADCNTRPTLCDVGCNTDSKKTIDRKSVRGGSVPSATVMDTVWDSYEDSDSNVDGSPTTLAERAVDVAAEITRDVRAYRTNVIVGRPVDAACNTERTYSASLSFQDVGIETDKVEIVISDSHQDRQQLKDGAVPVVNAEVQASSTCREAACNTDVEEAVETWIKPVVADAACNTDAVSMVDLRRRSTASDDDDAGSDRLKSLESFSDSDTIFETFDQQRAADRRESFKTVQDRLQQLIVGSETTSADLPLKPVLCDVACGPDDAITMLSTDVVAVGANANDALEANNLTSNRYVDRADVVVVKPATRDSESNTDSVLPVLFEVGCNTDTISVDSAVSRTTADFGCTVDIAHASLLQDAACNTDDLASDERRDPCYENLSSAAGYDRSTMPALQVATSLVAEKPITCDRDCNTDEVWKPVMTDSECSADLTLKPSICDAWSNTDVTAVQTASFSPSEPSVGDDDDARSPPKRPVADFGCTVDTVFAGRSLVDASCGTDPVQRRQPAEADAVAGLLGPTAADRQLSKPSAVDDNQRPVTPPSVAEFGCQAELPARGQTTNDASSNTDEAPKKSFVDVECSTEPATEVTSQAGADSTDSEVISLPAVESRNGDNSIAVSHLSSTMTAGAPRVGVGTTPRSAVHDSACNTDPVRVLPPEEPDAGSSTDESRRVVCRAAVRDFECNVRIVASSCDVACVADETLVTTRPETRDSATNSEPEANPSETRRQLVDVACGDDGALLSRPEVSDAACGTEVLETASHEDAVSASRNATTETTRDTALQLVPEPVSVRDASCHADIVIRSAVHEIASMTDPDRCMVCSCAKRPSQLPPLISSISIGCMTDVRRMEEVACGTDEEFSVRSGLHPSAVISAGKPNRSSPLHPTSTSSVDELMREESAAGQETVSAEATDAAHLLQQEQRVMRALSWSISQKSSVGTSKIPTRRRPVRKCDAVCNTDIVIAPRAAAATVSETLLGLSERPGDVERATRTDDVSSRVSTTSHQRERSNDDVAASGVQQPAAAADREGASVSAALATTTAAPELGRVSRPQTVDAACNTDPAPDAVGRAGESASSRRGGRTVAGSGVLRAAKPQAPVVRKRPMRDASCTADLGTSSLADAPSAACVSGTQLALSAAPSPSPSKTTPTSSVGCGTDIEFYSRFVNDLSEINWRAVITTPIAPLGSLSSSSTTSSTGDEDVIVASGDRRLRRPRCLVLDGVRDAACNTDHDAKPITGTTTSPYYVRGLSYFPPPVPTTDVACGPDSADETAAETAPEATNGHFRRAASDNANQSSLVSTVEAAVDSIHCRFVGDSVASADAVLLAKSLANSRFSRSDGCLSSTSMASETPPTAKVLQGHSDDRDGSDAGVGRSTSEELATLRRYIAENLQQQLQQQTENASARTTQLCDAAAGPDEPDIGERGDDVISSPSANSGSQSADVVGNDRRPRPSTSDVGCETDHAVTVLPTLVTTLASTERHLKDSSVQTEAVDQPLRDAEGSSDRKHRPSTSDVGCETDHEEMVIQTLATSVTVVKQQSKDSSVQTEIIDEPPRDAERSFGRRPRPLTCDVGCGTDHSEMVIPTLASSAGVVVRLPKDASFRTGAVRGQSLPDDGFTVATDATSSRDVEKTAGARATKTASRAIKAVPPPTLAKPFDADPPSTQTATTADQISPPNATVQPQVRHPRVFGQMYVSCAGDRNDARV
jgi:hypothetical protein